MVSQQKAAIQRYLKRAEVVCEEQMLRTDLGTYFQCHIVPSLVFGPMASGSLVWLRAIATSLEMTQLRQLLETREDDNLAGVCAGSDGLMILA